MSTFGGRLRECDSISIDNFTGENLFSQAFFLSHFHTDHMRGMSDDGFFSTLSRNSYSLYTHSLTKKLIETSEYEDTRRLHPYVVGREVNEKFTVYLDEFDHESAMTACSPSNRPSVNITFLPAKHCIGSIMILLEFSSGKNVLYTGDFRLSANDWINIRALRDPATGRVKRIDSLYFDSTFCDREYSMPSRQESKDELISQCRQWLNKDSRNRVLLQSYAHYGHEFLLCALFDALGERAHVSTEKYGIYKSLNDRLSNATSPDPTHSRVHACVYWKNDDWTADPEAKKPRMASTCPDCSPDDSRVMTIKASMMIFHMEMDSRLWFEDDLGVFHLSYSCHSSLKEVRSAFSFLQPIRAFPNVVDWKSGKTEEIYMRHFRDLLRLEHVAAEEKSVDWDEYEAAGSWPWNAKVDVNLLRSKEETRRTNELLAMEVASELASERGYPVDKRLYTLENEEILPETQG